MNRVLVIIDMQPGFSASKCNHTISACSREIKKSIQFGDFILFVEYSPDVHEETTDKLIRLTKGYSQVHKVIKHMDDGSYAVKNFLTNNNSINPNHIAVCGVNVYACVRDTISGLKNDFKVVAICDAINGKPSYSVSEHAIWLDDEFNNYPYTEVVLKYRNHLRRRFKKEAA